MGRQTTLSPFSLARWNQGKKSSGPAWLVVGSSFASASRRKNAAWSSTSGNSSSPNCTFRDTTQIPLLWASSGRKSAGLSVKI